MALSAGRRRVLAVLAALPGLALAAWWSLSDSYLDEWRARESALERRVGLFSEVAGLGDELTRLRAELTASIEAIRGAKAGQPRVPVLDPLLERLPAEPPLMRLQLEPGESTVKLWFREERPGAVLRLAETLRASEGLEGVILVPPEAGEPQVRALLVSLPGGRP